MAAREVLKALTPPILVRAVRRPRVEGLRFTGRPSSWAEALSQSTGYHDDDILDRVIMATREVVAGRASYERDSALFEQPSVPFQVVAGILRSASLDGGRACVVDVGGSLGSTFRRCRPFLATLEHLEWYVVEQRPFVEAGAREFATAQLRFLHSIHDVPSGAPPPTYLLSGVLQYVEHPGEMLGSLVERPGRHLILDRIPVSSASADRLCIQHAPPSVYDASYPSWVFSRDRLQDRLVPDWSMLADEPGIDGTHRTDDGLAFEFRTLIFECRS